MGKEKKASNAKDSEKVAKEASEEKKEVVIDVKHEDSEQEKPEDAVNEETVAQEKSEENVKETEELVSVDEKSPEESVDNEEDTEETQEEPSSDEENPDVASDVENKDSAQSEDVNDDSELDNDVESQEELDQEELDKDKTIDEVMQESGVSEDQADIYKDEQSIDEAVDEIVRTESDETIAEADAKIAALNEKKSKKTFSEKLKSFFVGWYDNKPLFYGSIFGLFAVVLFIALLPTTRYAVLNIAGVRVSTSMTVIDNQTRLPLENITVSIQDQTEKTDENGDVDFSDLKLGSTELLITKRGYADNSKEIVLGWGSNPIGAQEIIATGEQFTFVLSDWKSQEPITDAKATAGENVAKADETGKIVLTIGEDNIADVEVVVSAQKYRSETLNNEQLSKEEIMIAMVPSRKHVFVSNRDGQYDIYKKDLDGQNEELLLEATGKEREVPQIIPHPTREIVAFVSSRDGIENKDGFILDELYILDVLDGEYNRIARSEQLQPIGWEGDYILYSQVVEGTSRANPERSKIVSFNERTTERKDLASSNYFNDIKLVKDLIYYSVSSYAVPESLAKLFSIKSDGEDKEEVIDSQVWNIFRPEYDKLIFSADEQKWYEQELGNAPVETSSRPASEDYRFVDSPDGQTTAWVEIRDGRGVLLTSSTAETNEEQNLIQPGLDRVLYWVNNDQMVVQIVSNTETADYIYSLSSDDEPQKISDVTTTFGAYY